MTYRSWTYAELRRAHAEWVGPDGTGRNGRRLADIAADMGVHRSALSSALDRAGMRYPKGPRRLRNNRFERDPELRALCRRMHHLRTVEDATWREVAQRLDIRARGGRHKGEVSEHTAKAMHRAWRRWVSARAEAKGEEVWAPPAVGDTPRSIQRKREAAVKPCLVGEAREPGRCRLRDCSRPVRVRGLCNTCYQRARRHGKLDQVAAPDARRGA